MCILDAVSARISFAECERVRICFCDIVVKIIFQPAPALRILSSVLTMLLQQSFSDFLKYYMPLRIFVNHFLLHRQLSLQKITFFL